jgi:hypothetical protein
VENAASYLGNTYDAPQSKVHRLSMLACMAYEDVDGRLTEDIFRSLTGEDGRRSFAPTGILGLDFLSVSVQIVPSR